MIDWQARATAMTNKLAATGDLRSRAWRAAFQESPRHVFVPGYYVHDESGHLHRVDGADPIQRGRWLDAVYDDTVLVTQVKQVPDVAGGGSQLPTSSSTMPSIMAWMLETLDIQDGQRVLEIGTGTGYNAAILCHRLGSANVASIDLDPDLVDAAKTRLASVGYSPTVVAGDGSLGLAEAAPFDRIISTAAVSHIPPAWIDQLNPGGVILTDLRGSIAGGMVRLRETDDDLVQGHFLPYPASFMPLRPCVESPLREGEPWGGVINALNPAMSTTTVDPRIVATDQAFRFFLQLHLAGTHIGAFLLDPQNEDVSAIGPNCTWIRAHPTPENGRYPVQQGGPRRAWDTVETAFALWRHLGEPDPPRFGVSTSSDDHQHVWLDQPDSLYRWPLPL